MKPKLWEVPFKMIQLCKEYMIFKKSKRISQLAKSRLAIDN